MPVLRIGTSISVGTGTNTLFWLDRWSGNRPFAQRFNALFSICVRPHLSVHAALADLGTIAFPRTFGPLERSQWDEMLQCIALHSPSMEKDSLSWSLEPSGRFSTKSLYHAMLATLGPTKMTLLWEIKLLLKIHIFLWQWVRGRLPSGTEVRKRNGPGDGLCPLCGVPEDSNHIFFRCLSAVLLWSCIREVIRGDWNHDNLPDLF